MTFSIYFQLIADVVLETVIIHYSGGIDSVFVFLYVPTVVFGSFIFPGRGSGIIAGCSFVCYSALVTAEYYGVLAPHLAPWSSYAQGWTVVLYLLCFRMAILGIASYLSSYLSRLLSEKTKELFRVKTLSDRVMEVMAGGVITADKEDRILFANNYALNILNTPAAKLIGTDWKTVFKISEDAYSLEGAATAAKIDIPFNMPDGKTRTLNINISFLFDEKETPTGKVIIFQDVTEMLDLRRTVQQNEKLVLMGELAGGMAHEIRNPLGSICGSIQLLRERGSFEKKDMKLIDIILKEADHLNTIIEEFLYYSKGKPKELGLWNAQAVIDDVVTVMRNSPRLAGSGISILWQKGRDPIAVSIDVDQIKQVLVNLITNAIDALPRGGTIEVQALADSDRALIFVKDTGVGIPADLIKRIFDPFFSTKDAGYGIGLALCQKIVENHRGTIDVESAPGKGTTFIVTLPLAR